MFELAEQKQVNQLRPVGAAAQALFDPLDQPRKGDSTPGTTNWTTCSTACTTAS
jgi:hypothetical protein